MNYKLTLVYFTYRPGGFDILADSLNHQTYKNYELIVIDDYPGRNLKSWLEEQGIPVAYYGPMKEKVLKDTTYSQANIMNTALLYTTGDIFIICNDYQWLPPDSFERWNFYFNTYGLKCLVSACGEEFECPNPSIIGDVSVWSPPFTGNFDMFGGSHLQIPEEFETFYTAIPTQYLLDINGFDERADYWCVFFYQSILSQAKLNGMWIMVDRGHFVKMINHRPWSIGGSRLWYITRTGGPARWDSPLWVRVSPNKFNLKEMRKK